MRERIAASLVGVGVISTVALLPWAPWNPTAYAVPFVVLAAAPLLLLRNVRAQLVSRTVLWSTLLFSTVIAYAWPHDWNLVACLLFGATSGAALLALGANSLAPDDGAHALPLRAFRPQMTLAFVVAGAVTLGALYQLSLAFVWERALADGGALEIAGTVARYVPFVAVLGLGTFLIGRLRLAGNAIVVVTLAALAGTLAARDGDTMLVRAVVGAVVIEGLVFANVFRALYVRRVPAAPSRAWGLVPTAFAVALLIALGVLGVDKLDPNVLASVSSSLPW